MMSRGATGKVLRLKVWMCRAMVAALPLMLSSCFMTTIGHWDEAAYKDHNYGAWRTVRVCTYLDRGVTKSEALALMSDWTSGGEADRYHIHLVPEGFKTLPRDGFLHNSIMDEVARIPLKGNCDRVFYFVKHSVADYVYADAPNLVGVFPPEILGEVDDKTMTHGWAFVNGDNFLSALIGSKHTTWHEFYHLLGSCPHSWTMDACYGRIAALKLYSGDNGFYASMGLKGRTVFTSRRQVNMALASWKDPLM